MNSEAKRAARVPRSLAVLSVLIFLALPFREAAPAQDPYRETALSFIGSLIQLFPPAEGYVVSVTGGEVYVDLSETELMRPGMELLVYREGADIVHPVTGDVLGKYEEKVGYLIVGDVQEKYSVGTPVEGTAEIRSGDRVRISTRPLRTLLLFSSESPLVDSGTLAHELVQAAQESQRFRITDEPEWLPRLKEAGLTIEEATADAPSLRKLGAELRGDLLLVVSPGKGGEQAVGLEAFSLWTGRTLVELREPWSPPPEPAPPPPSSPFAGIFGGGREDERRVVAREYVTKSLPGEARAVVTGDFTGEGGLEVLLSDGRDLTLYRWEDGGLIWVWEDKGPPDRRVLNLESGDLDGDGLDEALLTGVRKGWLATEALSWSSGEWHSLGKVDGHYFRLFDGGEGGPVILGQRAGVTNVFSGPVREYVWGEGAFREKEEGIRLAEGVGLFGLGLADLDGDGSLEVLSLGDGGRLRVFGADGVEVSGGGDDRYGGYPSRVTPEDLFGPRLVDRSPAGGFSRSETVSEATGKDVETEIRQAFQGRVLEAEPAGGERGAVVLVPRNLGGVGRILPNLRQFEKGEAVLLRWEGGRFEEVGRSRRQEGYIADVALGDADGDGRPEAFLAVNSMKGKFLGQTGTLVVWSYGRGGSGPGAAE